MARWRYLTEEERAERFLQPPPAAAGPCPDFFTVVDGTVRAPDCLNEPVQVPAGWCVHLLERELPAHSYYVVDLRVRVRGEIVSLKSGVLVAAFPPELLEKARAEAILNSRSLAVGGTVPPGGSA